MALAQDGSLPSNWTRFSDLIPSTEDRDMDSMPDDWEESLGLNPTTSTMPGRTPMATVWSTCMNIFRQRTLAMPLTVRIESIQSSGVDKV